MGNIDMLHSYDRIDRLIEYNENLEKQMDLIQLNERVIESNLEDLESILTVSDSIEKYSLCRLTELTLSCVENYSNNYCITEVGDFLINPRLILVHVRGEARPVIKERHTRLSDQFKDRACENCPVTEWLRLNTMTETVKKPILPHLLDLLKKNCCPEEYITSVKKRMNSIIDLLSHLHMGGIHREMNIEAWKSSLGENDRIMLAELFLKFDTTVFDALGEKIRGMYQTDQLCQSLS